MLSDIQIAQSAQMLPIAEVAAKLGVPQDQVIPYGRYKAKLSHKLAKGEGPEGKLILVTAISPTPAGGGKDHHQRRPGRCDVRAGQAHDALPARAEPGPGVRHQGRRGRRRLRPGRADGGHQPPFHRRHPRHRHRQQPAGGHDRQLHPAGNPAEHRPAPHHLEALHGHDDRQLRFLVDGLGGKVNGTPREDGFDITVASEIMAIFCLATDLKDLKERLSRIVCAYTYDGQPVTAGQIGAAGAMTALLKDAIDPNLVQTLENNPAIIHGGPFANIAHGCNSVTATRLGLKLADYVVTEAGFGADLGAEKFLDIKCRYAGLNPAAVVLVATGARAQVPRRRAQGGAEQARRRGRCAAARRTWPATSTTSKTASACRSAWRSMPSRPTRRKNTPSSALSAPKRGCPASCPKCSPKAARAARRWPGRCSA